VSSAQSSPARNAAMIAVFAGFVAALGVIPAFQPPGFSVPITAQSLGVMLAGAILGARRGFASLVLFLALVAVGLPLLASRGGGLAPFFTPSVGFLLAWPVAAFVIGWLTERGGTPYKLHWGLFANFVGGIVVMYVGGILGLVAVGGLTVAQATVATWIYIPGDLVKVVLAALIARGVHAAYPGLLPTRVRREKEPESV
jgi:biotin transport system substrate-specific component